MFKRFQHILFGVAVFMFVLTGLKSCNLFFDEGQWTSEPREASGIDRITVESIFKVYYHPKGLLQVEVCYYDNLMEHIETEVRGPGELVLRNTFTKPALSGYRKPEVHIYGQKLKKVELKEASGFVCMDTLTHEGFELRVEADLFEADVLYSGPGFKLNLLNTAGLININGRAAKAYINNKGKASIRAECFRVTQMELIQHSALETRVCVMDSLRYYLYGGGDILLYGSPVLSGTDTGIGNLIMMQ